jgi:hypothetical protein
VFLLDRYCVSDGFGGFCGRDAKPGCVHARGEESRALDQLPLRDEYQQVPLRSRAIPHVTKVPKAFFANPFASFGAFHAFASTRNARSTRAGAIGNPGNNKTVGCAGEFPSTASCQSYRGLAEQKVSNRLPWFNGLARCNL